MTAGGRGPVAGVLFDIDDTLIDLATAARNGFLRLAAGHLAGVPDADRRRAADGFAEDAPGLYERYMTGELSFREQRLGRLRHAYAQVGGPVLDEAELAAWNDGYESAMRAAWRPFDDVHPCLDELDRIGLPYGAVTNNVHDYQRAKLDLSGLGRIAVLVGSDTAGAPKPDPRPFRAGARMLGTRPEHTAYVGDSPVNDVRGARDAGLIAVLLDRRAAHASPIAAEAHHAISTLAELSGIVRGPARSADFGIARGVG